MKPVLPIILLFISISSYSQTTVKATVKDSQSKEPLGFCNVAVQGTKKGTITNADGIFIITVNDPNDVLLFSYVGYEVLSEKASDLIQKPEVFLVKKDLALEEVTIRAGNDYLYDIMENCRKKLLKNKDAVVSKVYYALETQSKTISVEFPMKGGITQMKNNEISLQNSKPVELLECFYNATMKGIQVEDLGFKNGRTALAANDNYFLSLNSSKALAKMDLISKDDEFPSNPLQYGKAGMKKKFIVEKEFFDGSVYELKFHPRNDKDEGFSGEVWIEKSTNNLLKINLKSQQTKQHPFVPMFQYDSIYNVFFDITNTYKKEGEQILPDHIYFNYGFTYRSHRDSLVLTWKNMTREITSNGILYFYDYDQSFILPYFDYMDDLNDYYKMSFIPYNAEFWNDKNILLQTEKQKEDFDVLSKKGQLINYREGNYGNDFLIHLPGFNNNLFYEFFYPFWSADKRLMPGEEGSQFEPYPRERINRSIKNDLYHLKVQFLLDVTKIGDSLLCRSYTVFDNDKSFYHLQETKNTRTFINIYFDICEIERRKMQAQLDMHHSTLSQIDSIYKAANAEMDKITSQYLKEVEIGENEHYLRKWNGYVLKNLNIDNLQMVENSKTK